MTMTHAQTGVRHVPIDTTRLYITEREQGYLLLLLAGCYDCTCSVVGAEALTQGAPHAESVAFEHSGRMAYVEENARALATVHDFLVRHGA